MGPKRTRRKDLVELLEDGYPPTEEDSESEEDFEEVEALAEELGIDLE